MVVEAFLIATALIIIDMLLLLVMTEFYFRIGIPIYKGNFMIMSNKTLEDIGVYIGKSKSLVYKITGKSLIFRSGFNYFNLYSAIGTMSIIKGDIRIKGNRAYITQRVNMTTIYFLLFFICIFISLKVNIQGYFILAVIMLIVFGLHWRQNKKLDDIIREMVIYMNHEDEKKRSVN